VSNGLRKVWVCLGCTMRVRNKSGRPISQPAKWENERCPKCRIDLAREEGGKEAAAKMAERLGLHRHRPARPKMSVDERRRRVREVVGEHPHWTNQRVADKIGASYQSVRKDRAALGLPRLGPGGKQRPEEPQPSPSPKVTAEQREQITEALKGTPRSDNEIAEEVGVTVYFVAVTRRELGLPTRRERVKAERDRRVAEAVAEHPDWGPKRIATAVGEPLNSVRRSLDRFRESGTVAATST
jgi:transposase